jgi:UDP-GlcNAc:undecaprenyl-phosphate/decaprenyl-phosphate GlcNAc-1-phosphate transferase
MIVNIFYLLGYLFISFSVLAIISKFSYKLNLIDIPNERKKHIKPTAYTGGLALSLIYIVAIYIFDIYSQKLNLILSLSFLIGIVGFIDDKYDLNIGGKLSLQILPIIYLIILENLNLTQLGNYNFFTLELGALAIPFTLLSILFLINSFNYFDGTDGALGITTISVLFILYFLTNDYEIKLFLIIILIPIFSFLFFNFSLFKLPKLFLGDSGSLLLGFIVAFTLIHIGNKNIIHPILLAFSISIFVYEFLSINIIRLINKKNPFKANQDHLHHIILKKTKSIFQTNLILFFTNIFLFFIGYLSFSLINPIASLISFLLLFKIFFSIRYKYR